MKNRILKNVGLLMFAAIILTFLLMNLVMYQKVLAEMKIAVENECGYLQYVIDRYGDNYLNQEVDDITENRILLIDEEGFVLFEAPASDKPLENHKERPEVQEAVKNGIGSDVRTSETLGSKAYYYAIRLEDGRVLRVSRETASVFWNIVSGFGYMIALLVVFVVLAFIVVEKMAKKIVQPINEINLHKPLNDVSYAEFSPLLLRIHQQNQQIREYIKLLERNQEEYQAITEYMQDGLIVTNQRVVLSINRAAQQIFEISAEECMDRDIITVNRSEALKVVFLNALKGNTRESILKKNGKVYQLLANPVQIQGKVSGAAILILDVTEKQAAEEMRREFTANVSHELKTPLMSISGYAEIMKNGMVKPEDVQEFSGRIYAEASRLSALVEDIIHLSQLDENKYADLMKPVDLSEIMKAVAADLEFRAAEQGITICVTGETQIIDGVEAVLYEMIYNLCSNAIKYNHRGGSVEMSLEKTGVNEVRLTVKDNGIGIPLAEQDRIFERFYRVDKSHSRESGGTGLGLSIVKHGAILHHAKISLESQEEKGTKVELSFRADA